jgi:hypothetical protein
MVLVDTLVSAARRALVSRGDDDRSEGDVIRPTDQEL